MLLLLYGGGFHSVLVKDGQGHEKEESEMRIGMGGEEERGGGAWRRR